MKKLKLLTLLGVLCFILFFSACGRNRGEDYMSPHLKDLDHMLYVMQNNFALFDVAYWARGVDIYSIVDTVREIVLSSPEMTTNEFFDVLFHEFAPLNGIGHFQIIDLTMYNYMVFGGGRFTRRDWYSHEANVRLRAPHVLAFYEQLYTAEFDLYDWMNDFSEILADMTEQEIRAGYSEFLERLIVRGETELAEEYIQALINADAPEIFRIWPYVTEALANNVTTRILEDGRIAYLAIDNFLNYPIPPDEERQIHHFYDEIRYFDHLIVDLRFNPGGLEG